MLVLAVAGVGACPAHAAADPMTAIRVTPSDRVTGLVTSCPDAAGADFRFRDERYAPEDIRRPLPTTSTASAAGRAESTGIGDWHEARIREVVEMTGAPITGAAIFCFQGAI
jgi:hypothetical protein